MKLLFIVMSLISLNAKADYTHGYYRRNGTYVAPYEHTHPDNNPYNNYDYQREQQREQERQRREQERNNYWGN